MNCPKFTKTCPFRGRIPRLDFTAVTIIGCQSRVFPYWRGWQGIPAPSTENLLIPLPGKILPQDSAPTKFLFFPPKVNSPQPNNIFHAITQLFSCSHYFCTNFLLTSYPLYTQVMLILIGIPQIP